MVKYTYPFPQTPRRFSATPSIPLHAPYFTRPTTAPSGPSTPRAAVLLNYPPPTPRQMLIAQKSHKIPSIHCHFTRIFNAHLNFPLPTAPTPNCTLPPRPIALTASPAAPPSRPSRVFYPSTAPLSLVYGDVIQQPPRLHVPAANAAAV